ncbi:MAG: C4-type zinc ribbon domain-containing protein [Spirochaetaceae bacterium]|nr:C4-type zinc ribbon domain-containing protein [Spirochaetaceae bacterium]GMO29164.1 MAG: C4-type zinc ribbon domain-containing protein [Termitinemataceae bacterium]
MTTEDIIDRLRELQDVLCRKIALEREIIEIPKSLSSQEELVLRLKQNYIARNEEYVECRQRESEFRNMLLQAESEREKAEKKMDSIETQREYEALDKEIKDAANKEHNYRRDLQLAEQKVAALKTDMDANKELVDQQAAELAERKISIEEELSERNNQLSEIINEEKKLTANLDPELIFKFERIIRKKGGRGIVAVRGGVCNSCHMILPVQFANAVRLGSGVLSCPYCSSILYYEEIAEGEEDFFNEELAGSLVDLDNIEDDEFEEDEEFEEFEEKLSAEAEE